MHKGHRVKCQWSKQLQASDQSHRSQKNLLQILEMYFLIFVVPSRDLSALLLLFYPYYSSISSSGSVCNLSSPANVSSYLSIIQNPTQVHIHFLNHRWLLHSSDKNSPMAFYLSQDQFQPTQHGSNSCAGTGPRSPPQLFLLSLT